MRLILARRRRIDALAVSLMLAFDVCIVLLLRIRHLIWTAFYQPFRQEVAKGMLQLSVGTQTRCLQQRLVVSSTIDLCHAAS